MASKVAKKKILCSFEIGKKKISVSKVIVLNPSGPVNLFYNGKKNIQNENLVKISNSKKIYSNGFLKIFTFLIKKPKFCLSDINFPIKLKKTFLQQNMKKIQTKNL